MFGINKRTPVELYERAARDIDLLGLPFHAGMTVSDSLDLPVKTWSAWIVEKLCIRDLPFWGPIFSEAENQAFFDAVQFSSKFASGKACATGFEKCPPPPPPSSPSSSPFSSPSQSLSLSPTAVSAVFPDAVAEKAVSGALDCGSRVTHTPQHFNCTVRENRVLLHAAAANALEGELSQQIPVPAAVVAVDASGSMTYNRTARVDQARLCLKTVEDTTSTRFTSISKFGVTSTKVPNAAAFFIDNDVGTAFVAAGNGLAGSYRDIAALEGAAKPSLPQPPVNAVFITDCEQVGDRVAAKRVFEALPLTGAVVFVGIGDKHTISSLMAVAPERCEEQVFYIKVPESTLGTAPEKLGVSADTIVEALLSVQISYVVRDSHGSVVRSVNARVRKGADYLFPLGVQINDIMLYGQPLGTVVREVVREDNDAPMTLQQLRRYIDAATLNIVRAYNFALAKLELETQPHIRRVILSAVAAAADKELLFITNLRRSVVEEEGVSIAAIVRARKAIEVAACGAASSTSSTEVRRTVRRMRDPRGSSNGSVADEIVEIFRALRNRVCEPPSAESTLLANNLLDALGSGNMGESKVARLLGKTASRQDAGLYAAVANTLQMYEDAKEAAAEAGHVLTELPAAVAEIARSYFSCEADVLDGMVDEPVVCTATFESVGCMVAVGSLKRVLAGAMNPLLTQVVGASREPYKIQAVRLCGDDGFRASAGFANGIVGVFPGDSLGAALAFKLISSNMATGDWNTAVNGLRPLLALLAGVAYVLKHSPTASDIQFAEKLVHGFLGVAARVKCRVLGPDGTADLTTPVVSGLTACRDLLRRAYAEPFLYAGNAIMGADYWQALEFAMQYAGRKLGENYAVSSRPAHFTHALVVAGIARFANFFVTPTVSSDERLEFDAQKRGIDQFVKGLPLYVGQRNDEVEVGFRTSEDEGVDIKQISISYCPRNVRSISRHETRCISTSLEFARRFDCLERDATGFLLENSVRATFWEAVARPGSLLERLVQVYVDPVSWETEVDAVAQGLRDAHETKRNEELRKVCKASFLNAATSLPIALYGATARQMCGFSATGAVIDLTPSMGHLDGMLPNMCTGMLKDLCLAVDSNLFLRGSAAKYIQDSFSDTGLVRERTFFPRFHASMTAWAKGREGFRAIATIDEFLATASAEWPGACPQHLRSSVLQWVWQRAAFKAVATAALPIDAEAIVLQCSLELKVGDLDARAADWHGSCKAENQALNAAYGTAPQWSYYRAVVEFYAALRSDTDVFTGVFNAARFLALLRQHRGFVVSRRMFRESLMLHGVCAEDLDGTVSNEVYAAMALQTLH